MRCSGTMQISTRTILRMSYTRSEYICVVNIHGLFLRYLGRSYGTIESNFGSEWGHQDQMWFVIKFSPLSSRFINAIVLHSSKAIDKACERTHLTFQLFKSLYDERLAHDSLFSPASIMRHAPPRSEVSLWKRSSGGIWASSQERKSILHFFHVADYVLPHSITRSGFPSSVLFFIWASSLQLVEYSLACVSGSTQQWKWTLRVCILQVLIICSCTSNNSAAHFKDMCAPGAGQGDCRLRSYKRCMSASFCNWWRVTTI